MAKQKETNEKKEKSHAGRNIGIGVLLALLLSGGGYFGFGPGQGALQEGLGLTAGQGDGTSSAIVQEDSAQQGSNSSSTADSESSAVIGENPSKTDETKEKEDSVVITVKESAIYVNGQEMDAKKLEEYLSATFITGSSAAENAKNLSVVVKDEKAIKASYDEVIALLTKLDIPYSEE